MQRVKDYSNIRCIQADLDGGLPFLGGDYYDGALIIGAYHFLKEKERLFETVSRILKKGGVFCVGYAYINRDTYDQEIMDLRLMLREPPANPVTPEKLIGDARKHGFELVSDEGTLGCFGWYLFRKTE